jgi:hypothetical protein
LTLDREQLGVADRVVGTPPTVWPDSVRPERSGIVTEAITGTSRTPCSNSSAIAYSDALQLSVSMWVSVISRSTPPSISARACSA